SHLEFPPVAARLRGAVHLARALAGFHATPSLRGHPRLSAARASVRPRNRLTRFGLMGKLVQRLIVAAIGIPVALTFIYVGELPLALFLATIAALGAGELFDLARRRGIQPFAAIGIP